MPWIGGAIAAGGSLLSGIFGSNAASSAARTQSQASDRSVQAQLDVARVIQQQLAPFLQAGQGALGQLPGAIGSDNTGARLSQLAQMGWGIQQPNLPDPSNPATINQFQQSPGYQYALQQSGDAIQNSAAGKTGALSGNMLKALQGNAIGLADQDYGNWFTNATNFGLNKANSNNKSFWDLYNAFNTGDQQTVNNLQNLAGLGQNAAANLGTAGVNLAGNVGNTLIGQGQAQAVGQLGSAGALTGGFNQALQALLAPNNSGNSTLAYLLGQGGGQGGWGSSDGTGGF